MKKSLQKRVRWSKSEKTLGVLSAGAIAASAFMGYNRLTGNVISSVEGSTLVSLGGVALFVLGILGILLVIKGK